MTVEEHEKCTRCEEVILQVHPVAWMVVDVYCPAIDALSESAGIQKPSDALVDRSLLCANCMVALGEWMVPGLKDDPEWISGTDQLNALLRDYCPKVPGQAHLWYTDVANESRFQKKDWCTRCGISRENMPGL